MKNEWVFGHLNSGHYAHCFMELDETAADGLVLDEDNLVPREEDSDEDSEEGTPREPELRGLADGVTQPQRTRSGAKIGDSDRLTSQFLGHGALDAALEHVGTMEKRLKLQTATTQGIYVSRDLVVPHHMQRVENDILLVKSVDN